MSNLTSTSAEISASKISARNESGNYLYPQQTYASINQEQVIIQPSNKKKRNLPGNPGLTIQTLFYILYKLLLLNIS